MLDENRKAAKVVEQKKKDKAERLERQRKEKAERDAEATRLAEIEARQRASEMELQEKMLRRKELMENMKKKSKAAVLGTKFLHHLTEMKQVSEKSDDQIEKKVKALRKGPAEVASRASSIVQIREAD